MDYSIDSFDFKYKTICSIGLGCYSEVFKVRSLAHEDSEYFFIFSSLGLYYFGNTCEKLLTKISLSSVQYQTNCN